MNDTGRPEIVPAFSSVRLVMFPGASCSILVQGGRAWRALDAVRELSNPIVALFAARNGPNPDPDADELYEVGTLARVLNFSQRPCCGKWVAELEGLARVHSCSYVRDEPYREVRVGYLCDPSEDSPLLRQLALAVEHAAMKFRSRYPECHHTVNAIRRLQEVSDPADVPGAVAELLLHIPVCERQKILEMTSVAARLEAVLVHLHGHMATVGGKITLH